MSATLNPLTSPAPSEVPLPRAPLARVIAQVRFPLIASVESQEFIAPFQEAIRRDYPVLRQERAGGIVLGPMGAAPLPESRVWRFSDSSKHWRASLAPDFVALETTSYTSRGDMLDRLGRLLRATEANVNPQLVDRVGVRYIDRIAEANLDRLGAMLRPEVAGLLSAGIGHSALHSLSENIFTLPGESRRLLARWGLIPENATYDANALEAIPQKSWILDLDVFDDESRPFDTTALLELAQSFAETSYKFFRWAVTDEFLREYGASI